MESSSLTKAHDHARAAAMATHTADTTVAINEHTQAAGEFANASRSTSSVEALRTLKLLEQHHKRLSELLKLPIGRPRQAATNDTPDEDEKEAQEHANDAASTPPPSDPASPTSTKSAAAKPPPSLPQHRYPGRSLSSSIANNLASARGIRAKYSTQPLTPSVSNDQAPGSLEVHPRREGSFKNKTPDQQQDHSRKPSWVPPVIQEDTETEAPKPEPASPTPTPTPTDEGFSRFYSTFGSLINRLSAPLAFAGLPLVSEEAPPPPAPTPAEPPQRKRRDKQPPPSAEPDLSKIYSRATLRSLARDGPGPNDSFYVVPTSGHTASYASILNHENKEKRRLAASIHRGGPDADDDNEDDDDFVDARESQAPGSPSSSRRHQRQQQQQQHAQQQQQQKPPRTRSEKELRNMVEELHLENSSLKDVLDKVSKRLHAFELNSQSSHLALAQSLRLQRPGSPTTSSSSDPAGAGAGAVGAVGVSASEEALRRRNRELEEQMSEMVKRMENMDKDHLKLQLTVEKYRERWEKLKAGAKARREAQDLAGEGGSGR